MLDLRDLECLTALARNRHFARAAKECGMSQPAFSVRIRNLEERLNTQIVHRGNRFQGLTAEGEIVLARAVDILDQMRSLEEEVRSARGEVVGLLRLGTIPTAAAYAAEVAALLRERHPGVRLRVDTSNSLALQQGLEDSRFDAVITYEDGVGSSPLRVETLYDERYVIMVPKSLHKGQKMLAWAKAAELPLILLEPEMQNRRIVDQVFAEIGVEPTVISETDGFMAAVAMAMKGLGAAVLPEVLVDALGTSEQAVLLPLVDPVIEKSVCLVTPLRPQVIPVVGALRASLGLGT